MPSKISLKLNHHKISLKIIIMLDFHKSGHYIFPQKLFNIKFIVMFTCDHYYLHIYMHGKS